MEWDLGAGGRLERGQEGQGNTWPGQGAGSE